MLTTLKEHFKMMSFIFGLSETDALGLQLWLCRTPRQMEFDKMCMRCSNQAMLRIIRNNNCKKNVSKNCHFYFM